MGKLHYFTILVLIILLAIASGSIFNSLDISPVLTEKAPRHVPDYFLQNFTATSINKQGAPDYKVTANSLNHFPDDDSMKLQQPVFTFYQNRVKTWIAQANEAVILQRQNIILLTGDVILKQVAPVQEEPLLLSAKQLTIEPDKKQASTVSTIKLVKGKNQIEANGMRADLITNRIEFLSDTRSHYVLPAQ